jgi:Fe2+ or Zn2+ uptake regulation protein
MRTTLSPQTRLVLDAVRHVVANGHPAFTPADIAARLREIDAPLGAYQVRAELHALEQAGHVIVDAATASFSLIEADDRRHAAGA